MGGTWITVSGFGRRLMHLTYSVLQKEADLRFALVRVLCLLCCAMLCELQRAHVEHRRLVQPGHRHVVPAVAPELPSQSADRGVGTRARTSLRVTETSSSRVSLLHGLYFRSLLQ